MKFFVLIGLVAIVGVLMVACGTVPEPPGLPAGEQSASDLQPLRLDDEPLLLLDDEPLLLLDDELGVELGENAADNSRCYVCHMNYMSDSLALTHAAVGMGCNECHGESDEHIADESWAWGGTGTPPEVMYTLDEINPFCTSCHHKDALEGEMHEAVLTGTSEAKYCTNCHGEHRMAVRKMKWK